LLGVSHTNTYTVTTVVAAPCTHTPPLLRLN
jgi:hypothetical protein